jgi:hypothetical protein
MEDRLLDETGDQTALNKTDIWVERVGDHETIKAIQDYTEKQICEI